MGRESAETRIINRSFAGFPPIMPLIEEMLRIRPPSAALTPATIAELNAPRDAQFRQSPAAVVLRCHGVQANIPDSGIKLGLQV